MSATSSIPATYKVIINVTDFGNKDHEKVDTIMSIASVGMTYWYSNIIVSKQGKEEEYYISAEYASQEVAEKVRKAIMITFPGIKTNTIY